MLCSALLPWQWDAWQPFALSECQLCRISDNLLWVHQRAAMYWLMVRKAKTEMCCSPASLAGPPRFAMFRRPAWPPTLPHFPNLPITSPCEPLICKQPVPPMSHLPAAQQMCKCPETRASHQCASHQTCRMVQGRRDLRCSLWDCSPLAGNVR